MTEPLAPVPAGPAWVRKRDGRLVPFEADRISRGLFAAAESLGRPNAFLARELTDGIVHFLAVESEHGAPSTEQVAELVVKIVRELGHPALARAYAEHRARKAHPDTAHADLTRYPEITLRFAPDTPLDSVLHECAREHTLQTIYTRDLIAAHREGLITLTGLDTPRQLAGLVLPAASAEHPLLDALVQARQYAGRFVALDGPEYQLADAGSSAAGAVAKFLRDLELGLPMTGLSAIVNLNCGTPPAWAGELAEGPLFAPRAAVRDPGRLAALADELGDALTATPAAARIDWHLGEQDFHPAGQARLLRQARRALEGSRISFVLDRARRPVALAEGMDRRHEAVLLVVGLGLSRLADLMGADADPARYTAKLGSLARLALSAAAQKREALRRQGGGSPALARGFLIDRAGLVVAPVDLEGVVHRLTQRRLVGAAEGLECARQIVLGLRDVLRQDGQARQLGVCVDGPGDFVLEGTRSRAGLTAWDGVAAAKEQLRGAGILHGIAEAGTAALLTRRDAVPTPEQLAGWLHWAWQRTDVVRVRIVAEGADARQLTLAGSES